MINTIILVIGILFIVNGITAMGNSKVIEKVRSQMPQGCDIYFGGSKGLLLLSSTDAMIAVGKNGSIAKAFCIKSGWLRKSRLQELYLNGYKMESIPNHL